MDYIRIRTAHLILFNIGWSRRPPENETPATPSSPDPAHRRTGNRYPHELP